MNFKSNNTNKGFTLVELIIVVAVIAILATVLAPQYIRYVERSRQSNDLQVATNLMRATTVALADPMSNVPSGSVLEVLWATGEGTNPDYYGGKLYIREPRVDSRQSVIASRTVAYEGVSGAETLAHLQEMILATMGVSDIEEDFTGTGAVGQLRDAESAAGNSTSFCFHIHTTTGEIALAGWSQDGDVNDWIDEIGVEATRAP